MSVPLEVTLYCYNLPTDQEGPPTLRSVINRYGMLPRPLDIPDDMEVNMHSAWGGQHALVLVYFTFSH